MSEVFISPLFVNGVYSTLVNRCFVFSRCCSTLQACQRHPLSFIRLLLSKLYLLFTLADFSIFSLLWVLNNFVVCLGVVFFIFFVLGGWWVATICRFIVSIKCGNSSAIISYFLSSLLPPAPPALASCIRLREVPQLTHALCFSALFFCVFPFG